MGTQAEDLEIAEPGKEEFAAVGSRAKQRLATEVPSASALAAFHLQKTYAKRRVVDDVSLHVERGEVVGLLGANGAGKTTTFYMIVGLEQPDSGMVRLGDRDVTKLPMYLRARLGLGYLPQSDLNGLKSCWKSLVSRMCATPAEMRFQAGKEEEQRLRAPWPRNRSTFCSMSPLPESIRRQLTTFKM